MLDFFRKYQRYFLIVIAIVIVISFSFFGTHHTPNTSNQIEDYSIGKAIDGSNIMRKELDEMIRFLSSDREDLTLIEKRVPPNFFNNGVIRNDLLEKGIGTLLVSAYFDELKENLCEKMEKHKTFRPYHHPTVPFISVDNLLEQVLPTQKKNLDYFLNEVEEMSPQTFSLLVDLYLGERAFPPHILQEYLLFQQQNYNWVEPDPDLHRTNLNLFQCRCVEEWFGPQFLELSAQFIINAALIAKEKGYKVSYQEARVDLIRNGYESLKIQKKNEKISDEEMSSFWKEQLDCLNLSEKSAVSIWQKVMLFRRLFKDQGEAVFVDPHMYQTFHGFTSKTAEVDLYRLPDSIVINDFHTFMKLELYLDAVSDQGRDSLLLPTKFMSANEVEKKFPDLVEKRFLVEVSKVLKDNIALNVGMKEMWEWQLKKENYELLQSQFPVLAIKNAQDAEEYFGALEGLDTEKRQEIDRFSRNQIVDLHPEWIETALDQSHLNKKSVSFTSRNSYLPFEGLTSADVLLNLFSTAALKDALETDQDALEARKKLEVFTSDGETYYRFHVIDRDLNKTVMTFDDANQKGILDPLLEKHLGDHYVQLRVAHPVLFKNAENEWKPLKEVQNEVGRLVYNDLFKAIENHALQSHVILPTNRDENLDDFYSSYRLYAHINNACNDIKRFGEKSVYLSHYQPVTSDTKLVVKPSLDDQWGVIIESQVFKNHEKSPWFSSDIFSMVEKSWSDVTIRKKGCLSFFQLKEKLVPNGDFSSEIKKGQAILSREAQRLLMTEIIKKLKKTEVIYL